MYKAELKAYASIISTFIFREQASVASLMLRNCLDSFGGPSLLLPVLHLAHRVSLLGETLIFDIGPCEHLRQNESLYFGMKLHGLRILGY